MNCPASKGWWAAKAACSPLAGPRASLHRHWKPEQVLSPGEGGVNPKEEPSGKASWRQWCFKQALKSGEDVAQLRLADGIMDGGAAHTKGWRQEKQVVPGVWCGMS